MSYVVLARKYRPKNFAEMVGQEHVVQALGNALATQRLHHAYLFTGPPGVGKTTIARLLARETDLAFVQISAIFTGVPELRKVFEAARLRRRQGRGTLLFVDEIHRFNKAQQDALLPQVEDGTFTLVGATTENPSFSVIAPLLSRSLLLTLEALSDDDLRMLVERAVVDPRGLAGAVSVEGAALDAIVRLASGDARRALTALEAAAQSASASTADGEGDGAPVVTAEIVAAAVDRALLRYDRQGDEHYDVISAFIKSIRGSDPDAALH